MASHPRLHMIRVPKVLESTAGYKCQAATSVLMIL